MTKHAGIPGDQYAKVSSNVSSTIQVIIVNTESVKTAVVQIHFKSAVYNIYKFIYYLLIFHDRQDYIKRIQINWGYALNINV